jgi:hypothetical protein
MLQTTTDQETIREWAEEHGLLPAVVDDLSDGPDELGELTFSEPGGSYGAARPVDWSEFFEQFEDEELALVYDDDVEEDSVGEPLFRFAKRDEVTPEEALGGGFGEDLEADLEATAGDEPETGDETAIAGEGANEIDASMHVVPEDWPA